MSKRLQIVRSANATAVLSNGEMQWDFASQKLRIHDGYTAGGRAVIDMTQTGFGYVFPTPLAPGINWSTSSPTEFKLVDSSPGGGDEFGSAVDIADEADIAVVGSPGDVYGSVVVYTKSGDSWSQTARLEHSDQAVSDQLGWSVATNSDGTYVIAGNPWDDDLVYGDFNYSNENKGSAYIFYYNGTSWSQQAKLTEGADRGTNNFLGSAVDLNSDATYAIVGKYNQGVAFIFTRSGTSWSLQQKLSPSDLEAGDRGGQSVSINSDGTYAIVGAPREEGGDGNPISDAGAVYVFTRSGSTWSQQAKLSASDAQASDQFGSECSISDDGDYIVVGAPFEDGGSGDPTASSGAAYIFNRSGSTWTQQAILRASDTQAGDWFGSSVSISGDGTHVVVGAKFEDGGSGDPASNAGAAYVYKRDGTSWTEERIIYSSDAQTDDDFGTAVRINKDASTIISGAPEEDGGSGDPISNAGAAYIYEAG